MASSSEWKGGELLIAGGTDWATVRRAGRDGGCARKRPVGPPQPQAPVARAAGALRGRSERPRRVSSLAAPPPSTREPAIAAPTGPPSAPAQLGKVAAKGKKSDKDSKARQLLGRLAPPRCCDAAGPAARCGRRPLQLRACACPPPTAPACVPRRMRWTGWPSIPT
jgi:hypothetical protein